MGRWVAGTALAALAALVVVPLLPAQATGEPLEPSSHAAPGYFDFDGDAFRDATETVYLPLQPGTVQSGSLRLTAASPSLPGGALVRGSDEDMSRNLESLGSAAYAYVDVDGNGAYGAVDRVFLHFGPLPGNVAAGDIALNGANRFQVVSTASPNYDAPLAAAPVAVTDESYADRDGTITLTVADAVFLDMDGNEVSSAADVQLAGFGGTTSSSTSPSPTSSSSSSTGGVANLRATALEVVPASPSTQDGITFTVRWENSGTARANGHAVRIVLDGTLFHEWQSSALGAGAVATGASRQWTSPAAGSHTVQFVVDPYGDAPESNEVDNTRTATFVVRALAPSPSPTPGPSPTLPTSQTRPPSTSATTSPAPIDLGDVVVALVEGVKVTRDGDANVVSWPDDLVGDAGFQVWRSNSPYTLVSTLSGNSYIDSSDEALPDSRYLVTAFTGPLPSQGFFAPGTAPDQDDYPGVAAAAFPVWTAVGSVAGLLAIGVIAAVVLLRRRKRRAASGPLTGAAVAPQRGGQDVLAVQDIRVVRGERTLVDGVSFRIASGKTTLLFGPSGSGKSLLLKSIVGLVEHSGHVWELRPEGAAPLRKDAFGYVPQEIQLYPTLSAIENIVYFAGQFGIRSRDAKTRGLALLTELGLGDRADQELQKMSGGQQRRVSVAAALIHQPPILVMDEPSSGLDFSSRRTLWELLRRLAESRGIAVLASTHFIDEAEYASEVAIMYKGKLVAKGPVASLTQALPGHGRCAEVTFENLTTADQAKLRALLPELKKAGLAATASYRLYSARYYSAAPTTTMARLPGLLRASGLSARSSSLVDVGLDDVFTFLTGDVLPEEHA